MTEISGETLKTRILRSVGKEREIREVLLSVMEESGAEFCAFYAQGSDDRLYILLDGRELEERIDEVRSKITRAFIMFSNDSRKNTKLIEKVFYAKVERNPDYLFGDTRINSYFLTPVMFDSKIHGVLFLGSVRREAFTKSVIKRYTALAEEGVEGVRMYLGASEEDLVSNIIRSIPFGAALVSQGGRIIVSNETFEKVLGLKGEQLEDIEEVSRLSTFNLHTVWNEFKFLRRNIVGRKLKGMCVPERYLSVTVVTMAGLSHPVGSLVIIEDITDAEVREEESRELTASIAHEIRTPLTALKNSLSVIGSAVFSEEDGTRKDMEYLERFFKTATRTVDRLGRLVNGLIEFSYSNEDAEEVDLERVDLDEFLQDAVAIFEGSLKIKEIALEIHVDEGARYVFLDRDKMEQIVQNIVSNSIKHVPAGGRIEICSRRSEKNLVDVMSYIPEGMYDDLNFIEISIRDSGAGIDDSISRKVNRERPDERPVVRSSHGLGLYIAKKLIRKHAGSLKVERAEDEGTIVRLSIPADYDTREIIRNMMFIRRIVNEKADSGSAFVLYAFTKGVKRCWLEIASSWEYVPAVNPSYEEFLDGGFFFWPLGDSFAIAVSTENEFIASPLVIFDGSMGNMRLLDGTSRDFVKVGWAVCPIDGLEFSKLISTSIGKLSELERMM
ncbi:hypothetical protein DRQ05_00045 [bacterium]|nr:MAG: hypothetical protein DRQ05_00045 [bacterium]